MRAKYNIDSGCIDIVYADGTSMNILCNMIEDAMELTVIQRSEFDRLVYDHPIEFARLVLSGELENYLKSHARDYKSQEDNIRKQLVENNYTAEQADAIAREFMRYDN